VAGGVLECGFAAFLTEAFDERVLPGEVTIGRVAFAWVEELVFAVDVDDGDQVIELVHVEPLRDEDLAGAVRDEHGVGLHAGGAGHTDEELGELSWASTLAFEEVDDAVELPEASGLVFAVVMLAGEAGIVHLLHGRID